MAITILIFFKEFVEVIAIYGMFGDMLGVSLAAGLNWVLSGHEAIIWLSCGRLTLPLRLARWSDQPRRAWELSQPGA